MKQRQQNNKSSRYFFSDVGVRELLKENESCTEEDHWSLVERSTHEYQIINGNKEGQTVDLSNF